MKKKHIIALIISLSISFILSIFSLISSFCLFNLTRNINNSFLIGENAPINEIGYFNDLYLDSTTLKIYKKEKETNSWIFIVDLSNKINELNEDEGCIDGESIKTYHSISIDDKNTINGKILCNVKSAYNKETIIFLAEPTLKDTYELSKLFFNDIEVSVTKVFVENYCLYSTLMIDEDIKVRAEFISKVK